MRVVPVRLVVVCSATVLAAACGRSNQPDRGVIAPACGIVAAADAGGDAGIARLQDELKEGAEAARAVERLGYRLIARARSANDPGDYVVAEKAAECLDALWPGDPAALLLRGHVLHQLHRFGEAESAAVRLVSMRGGVLDYGLLGDVLMERGRVGEAAQAYQKMIDLKPFYQSYTRAAHLRWLKGDLDGATELIEEAISSASPRDPESIAWAYTRLSQYELQRGRFAGVEGATDAALANVPGYAAALLVRGRALTAFGRRVEALDWLRRAAARNRLPEYQWALDDALRACGLHDEAAAVERDLMTTGERTDPRTLALFLATREIRLGRSNRLRRGYGGPPKLHAKAEDRPLQTASQNVDRFEDRAPQISPEFGGAGLRRGPGRALALARAEYLQRQDVFTLDALAWAQLAAGRLDEARATIERALAEGTRDARLFLHAAAIAGASGRTSEALQWSRKANAIRFTLLPSELDILEDLRTSRTPSNPSNPGTPGTVGTSTRRLQ